MVQNGNLALHLACLNQPENWDVIELLLANGPNAMEYKDGDGNLPLHHALWQVPRFPTLYFVEW